VKNIDKYFKINLNRKKCFQVNLTLRNTKIIKTNANKYQTFE